MQKCYMEIQALKHQLLVLVLRLILPLRAKQALLLPAQQRLEKQVEVRLVDKHHVSHQNLEALLVHHDCERNRGQNKKWQNF